MPLDVSTELRDSTGKRIRVSGFVDEVITGFQAEFSPVCGRQAVAALQAPNSLWPVLTGFSKASFDFREDGNRVIILNNAESASGFGYPAVVEARTHAAERTLRRRGAIGGDEACAAMVKEAGLD